MDYEKEYKKLKANISNAYLYAQTDSTKAVLENICPELRESEDEKIRREIIESMRHQIDRFSDAPNVRKKYEYWLAWLEKQAEQKPVEESLSYGKTEIAEKLIALAECLEMDGECLFNELSGNDYGKLLRALAIELTEIKPVEWSKEDETNLTNTIIMLKEGASHHFTNFSITPCVNWLKSIKQRVQQQPKQERSKEDEVMIKVLDSIIGYIVEVVDKNVLERFGTNRVELFSWLKSLRPQKQWKPSDEQMEAFEHFVRSIGESGYASPYENNTKLLYCLLNDLKKLTE